MHFLIVIAHLAGFVDTPESTPGQLLQCTRSYTLQLSLTWFHRHTCKDTGPAPTVLLYTHSYTLQLSFTWLISSTHLKGHLASSCSAIMYSTVATLRSPPLWWKGVSSRSGSPSRKVTLMRTPYLLYADCKHTNKVQYSCCFSLSLPSSNLDQKNELKHGLKIQQAHH